MDSAMPSSSRVAALVSAFIGWLYSAGVLVAGLIWGIALRCDDACDGRGWRRSTDAWQWDGVVALGAITFVCGTALFVFVWRRRRLYAAGAATIGLVSVLAFATALSPDWADHLERHQTGIAYLAIGVLAPVIAVVLPGRTALTPDTPAPKE